MKTSRNNTYFFIDVFDITSQIGAVIVMIVCSWIFNYLCNQYLSPLMLWFRVPLMVRCTRYNIMWKFVRQVGGTPVSSTNKIDRHDIIEILLKVALNIIIIITSQIDINAIPRFSSVTYIFPLYIYFDIRVNYYTQVYIYHPPFFFILLRVCHFIT